MSQPLPLRVGALSHIGLVRRENQDRMGRFHSPHGEVFVVADGMGGHKGGSQAAGMVLDGLQAALCESSQPRSLRAALRSAAVAVNNAVCAAATSGDPTTDHMGSTAVLLVVRGREVMVGHLGDSRAYLWRQGRLLRLTRDHTWVQQLVDQKLLTEEEARNHPEASVLAHAFGRHSELTIELGPSLAIRPGDAVLLCSDGLSGYLEDGEVAGVLSRHDDPQKAVETLVEAALATGGHDNITVQLVVFPARPRWKSRRVLGRDGHVRRRAPLVSRGIVEPAAEPQAVAPPAAPEPPTQASGPDTTPTEPALPVAAPQLVAATSPRLRRRRVAGGLVVAATLTGGALLVAVLRHTLRPASPAETAPPGAAPVTTPLPAIPPMPVPTGQAPPAVTPGETPTPTVTPTPMPGTAGSTSGPAGGVP